MLKAICDSTFRARVTGVSMTSLALALAVPFSPAAAQDAAAPTGNEGATPAAVTAQPDAAAPEAETIVVTGSRIARSGFSTPTPVTVVGEERLQALAITNVADALNQLPSFRASSSPANQQTFGGSVGARVLDLRGLGAPRTLVLVDGRRFVPSTSEGTVDVNLIPSGLVQRTEVVTGGASAVYGSDAVAGVVNFILDRRFEGFKADIQAGISERGDDANQFASFTAGSKLGERGHVTIAAEYENNEGLAGCYEARQWCAQERSIVGNTPAGRFGLPSSVITSDVHPSTLAPGGLINRSLDAAGRPVFANVANDPLRGIQFLADGTPAPFAYGQLAGPLFMIGGDNHNRNPYLSSVLLKVPVERYSAYGSLSYDLTDDLKGFVDLSFGRVKGTTLSSTFRDFNGSLIGNIQRDNAYLPASIAATMAANGISQLTFGRAGFDLGSPKAVSTTKTYRAVAGLEGSLGSSWRWDAYYQYGRTDFRQDISNDPINPNLRKATDAVRTASGAIACRVNVDASTANDDPACVPINLFGENRFSDAARSYVLGTGFQTTRNTQHVAAANISGDLFNIGTRPVSLSVGGEWRRNAINGATDPISAINGFWVLNGQAVNGKQTVKEAYAETVVPLLTETRFARSLELNGAVRYTDYSDSGSVTTWKAGGVYEPVRAVRFRVTRSRDIRAPNLSELRGPQTKTTVGLTDPLTGFQANPVVTRGANPNLGVEKADSFTAGVVIAPTGGFFSRMRLSVDYYNLKVKDAIGLLGAQTLVQRCTQGATEFCPLVSRDPAGNILSVQDVLLNANALKTTGFDVEFDYRQSLGNAGDLSLRMLATIVKDLITTDSAGSLDRAGQTGSRAGTILGVPDYTLDGLLTYTKGPGSATLHGRYIPAGSYNVSFIGPDDPSYAVTLPTSVNNNRVPGRFYLDLAATMKVAVSSDREFELYGSINNLLDRDPPAIPSGNLGTNQVLFDPVGRAFRLGARVRFGG
ncbi:MAG: tonB dependent receptor family protein [Sphingomonas bacterium]|nr:tonB dependent receptor family protein [Sphingomonas bacterium]